ncbi:MAG TPA: hypothetical protein VHQ70_04135 [Syntrophomonadaceae bacterium]|nr:hypothetical protein [Syntrophomonadaceae bacterium]
MICPKCKKSSTSKRFPCPECGFNPSTCGWVVITCVYPPNDVVIESLLRSYDIPVRLLREAIGTVQGLSVGPLAEVKIAVPEDLASEAAELIKPLENDRE